MNTKPLVSICCLAFNHEKFVEDALKGFLTQKTNFSFEVLIHDDASVDNTPNIISSYQQKYPDIIKPILQKENQYSKGRSGTLDFNFPRAQGKFIAICEADDIWTDPYKLQKQVDILKKHPEYTMVCGNVNIINEESEFVRKRFNFTSNLEIDQNYLLENNHISTCTVLFREESLDYKRIPDGVVQLDKFMWFSIMSEGKCLYLNEVLASYRIHQGGTYSGLKYYQKVLNRLKDYKQFEIYFPHLKNKFRRKRLKFFVLGFLSASKNKKPLYFLKKARKR